MNLQIVRALILPAVKFKDVCVLCEILVELAWLWWVFCVCHWCIPARERLCVLPSVCAVSLEFPLASQGFAFHSHWSLYMDLCSWKKPEASEICQKWWFKDRVREAQQGTEGLGKDLCAVTVSFRNPSSNGRLMLQLRLRGMYRLSTKTHF